jgi:hypothetical protein
MVLQSHFTIINGNVILLYYSIILNPTMLELNSYTTLTASIIADAYLITAAIPVPIVINSCINKKYASQVNQINSFILSIYTHNTCLQALINIYQK